jgi:hypothetical protein
MGSGWSKMLAEEVKGAAVLALVGAPTAAALTAAWTEHARAGAGSRGPELLVLGAAAGTWAAYRAWEGLGLRLQGGHARFSTAVPCGILAGGAVATLVESALPCASGGALLSCAVAAGVGVFGLLVASGGQAQRAERAQHAQMQPSAGAATAPAALVVATAPAVAAGDPTDVHVPLHAPVADAAAAPTRAAAAAAAAATADAAPVLSVAPSDRVLRVPPLVICGLVTTAPLVLSCTYVALAPGLSRLAPSQRLALMTCLSTLLYCVWEAEGLSWAAPIPLSAAVPALVALEASGMHLAASFGASAAAGGAVALASAAMVFPVFPAQAACDCDCKPRLRVPLLFGYLIEST